MPLFDVYPLYNITPERAEGCKVFDSKGQEYLDLYGGHAVISIGHSHPHYVERIQQQVAKLGFYSNAVKNPLQEELASKLEALSGCTGYQLFLCNSGAEANENALKLASFQTGRKKILAFKGSFHGRTSAAVATTDNPSIVAPLNAQHEVVFCPLNDLGSVKNALQSQDVAAVIVECVQGVGGLDQVETTFIQEVEKACRETGTLLIADEVQAGYGRTGKFFAFQHHGIQPDIISMAKGMGNGFPIGGILIHPEIPAKHGMLGTTFGGNHLACAGGSAVLDVLEEEKLVAHAEALGEWFVQQISAHQIPAKPKGRGLMLGLAFDFPVGELRKKLLFEHHIFTGSANDPKVLRILPPLSVTKEELTRFFAALKSCLQ
ncbi:MAG: aminotransferase class III-fold pyridoxal phosphate-dependent enzyme [Flavobacteriales bacterium]|nr:aminotransferase class III-fold pyridoxal phosphate-dependent enzyme [Flavobacteriales bacterium]